MAGPWEQFQSAQPAPSGPWKQFQGAEPAPPLQQNLKPWEQFQTAREISGTPDEPGVPRLTVNPLQKAVEPITSYPSTYMGMNRESREQMATGVEQLGTKGERLKGAANLGMGALGYGFSPINAALRTVVGKPIEENTGIPKEYSEFTVGLAMPWLGFGRTPKTLQKIFSPETVSPEAMEAAGLIRTHTGRAARDTETTAQSLEAWQKPVAQLPPAEQLGIMHYIEGAGPAPRTPQMRAMADTMKDAFELRKAKLQALPEYAQRQFLDEYFPHFWTDPAAAANTFSGKGGFTKQGSGASLKTRVVPTIAEGIKNGLTPLTTNPIEATMRYVVSMDKFIASQSIMQAGKDTGTIVYRRPTIMGASGHPDALKGVPPGYAPLEGRGAKDATGATAYAPEAWARVYNNFISKGFEQFGGGEYGAAYNGLRRAANTTTQALLSFSGYHAFTMAEATMSNTIANAVQEARHMNPVAMTKELGKWATSPVAYAAKGKNYRDMYLGKTPMSPQDKVIIDLLTDAGGRMSGTKHALDYESSALGDYVTSFRRGRLRAELGAQAADIKANPMSGTARTLASNIGRVMDTFNKPLFQHYIPSVKNAAQYENMAIYLKNNPNATAAEKLAAARKVVDSVDNRFGEMIHDNIFWNKVAKQTAMLSMLSYSWNVGAWRELGGGARDIARSVVRADPLTPKADYIVGMTINWAMMSAMYQYMKTGEGPKDVHDLAAPRTGGVDARTGEPERIIPPGVMKDVFGYYEHFGQEAANKLNPALKIAGQTASIASGMGGQDWRGDPILSPRSPGQSMISKAPDWLAEYFSFITKTAAPIQLQNLSKGGEQGSALNNAELLMGLRKAPRQLTDPEGYERMMHGVWQRKWQGKERHDRQEQQRYGGTE